MIIPDLLISLILALLLTGLFMLTTRKAGWKKGSIWIFLIIFLITWAGGLWLKPFGPALWGIYWLPFLLTGLVVFLTLLIFSPPRPLRGRQETLDMLERAEQRKELEEVTYITFNLFFWILLLLLVAAIILRYVAGVNFR